MSNYPNNFDNDTTLPPAVFEENVTTYRFSCEANPGTTVKLKDALGSSFILPPGKSSSLRVSCLIVQSEEPTVVAQLVKQVIAHCSIGGTVTVNLDQPVFSYNPDGFFIMESVAAPSANLDFNITNNSFRKIKAAASIEVVSI